MLRKKNLASARGPSSVASDRALQVQRPLKRRMRFMIQHGCASPRLLFRPARTCNAVLSQRKKWCGARCQGGRLERGRQSQQIPLRFFAVVVPDVVDHRAEGVPFLRQKAARRLIFSCVHFFPKGRELGAVGFALPVVGCARALKNHSTCLQRDQRWESRPSVLS